MQEATGEKDRIRASQKPKQGSIDNLRKNQTGTARPIMGCKTDREWSGYVCVVDDVS